MTANRHAYGNSKDIKDTVGTIYGLAGMLQADECRAANSGEEAVFGSYEKGVIYEAIQRLASQALELAEIIEEEEERLSDLAARRDGLEGGL